MLRVATLGILLLCAACPTLHAQDTIQHLRDETASHSSGSNTSSDKSSSSNQSSSDCDDGLGAFFGGAIGPFLFWGLSSPFWGPPEMLNDKHWFPGYFPHSPYAGNQPGYLHLDHNGNDALSEQRESFWDADYLKTWSFRLSIEDGNDFNNLNRFNGRLQIDTGWRLGLVTNWDYLREKLPCGCIDETLLTDTNLTLRFAQAEWMEMHTGLGLRTMNDREVDRYGFNFLYGADVYPVQPFVLSGLAEMGSLGSAFVVHGRGTAGVIFHGCELFVGYDFLRVGSVNVQGPLAGLRFWF